MNKIEEILSKLIDNVQADGNKTLAEGELTYPDQAKQALYQLILDELPDKIEGVEFKPLIEKYAAAPERVWAYNKALDEVIDVLDKLFKEVV